MFDLFYFFFKQQLKVILKVLGWSLLAGFVLSFFSTKLITVAFLVPMVLYAATWPKTLLMPLFNFPWMATLPVSRAEIATTRVLLAFSGFLLIGMATVFQTLLSSVFLKPLLKGQRGIASTDPVVVPGTDITIQEQFSLADIFGNNLVYFTTFLMSVGAFVGLVACVSYVLSNSPSKQPKLSGNPWWHPVKKFKIYNWMMLVGLPVFVLILAPYGGNDWVGLINFALALVWVTYNCSLWAAINSKIPRGGVGFWLACLGGCQAVVALTAICLNFSLSFLFNS